MLVQEKQKAPGPISGTGIGLRSSHVGEILMKQPDIPWLELLADNHMAAGGLIPAQLAAVCEIYPVTFHSVGLSLGSTDPLDFEYLGKLKKLMRQHHVAWLSEHLCFTSVDGFHSHDLLPMPYSQESLQHMAQRITHVQDFLGERILVENVSSYMKFAESEMDESEFIAALAKQADCDLLIDVNNIYVNHLNLGIDPVRYIEQLPFERVREVHLAGYEQKDGFVLDAHNNPVSDPVWDLYGQLIQHLPNVPVLIEWDNDIPPLPRLMEEAHKADVIKQQYTQGISYAIS